MSDKLKELAAPFPAEDVEWRVSRAGISSKKVPYVFVLAYITSRAVMERLDSIFGIDGWQDDYEHITGGVVCHLKVRINDEWVTKTDGAPETNIEAFKGGISDALKRTAVKFGIGRYLYKLPESYAKVEINKPQNIDNYKYIYDKNKNVKGWWKIPQLPSWALPDGYEYKKNSNGNGKNGNGSDPNNGNGHSEPSQETKEIEQGRLALIKRADDMKSAGILSDEDYSKTINAIDKIQDLDAISRFNNKFDVQINAVTRKQNKTAEIDTSDLPF